MYRYQESMVIYICLIWTTSITNGASSISIHTIHIIAICPQTNVPVILQIYVHCTDGCIVCIKPSLVHPSWRNKKIQLLFTMLLPYICQHQICPQMPRANYVMCIDGKYANIYAKGEVTTIKTSLLEGEHIEGQTQTDR